MNLATAAMTCEMARRVVNAHAAQRHRRRDADAGAGPRRRCRSSTARPTRAIRSAARSCSGAAASRATMRSPGAMRAAPTRSASTSSRTARSPASRRERRRASSAWRPRAATIGAEQGRHGRRRAFRACSPRMAGFRLPIDQLCRCRRSSPSRSSRCSTPSSCRTRRGVYVSQSDKGELVHRRRHSTVHRPTRQRGSLPMHRGRASPACIELFPSSAACGMLRQWGGIVDVVPGRQPDHRQDAGREPLSSTAAGAPAASRRLPARGYVFAAHDRARASRIR